MKPSKILAAGAAAALAASTLAVVTLASPALAATTTNESGVQLFAQINNNGLAGVQNLQPTGTPDNTAGHSLSVTVSPAGTVVPGSPISVSISSSTLTLCNGPAAASPVNGEELDAVIILNGTQYLLRGPQNKAVVPISPFNNGNHAACAHPLFNKGWVVSSTAGGSSATSDTTLTAGTTGLGTATPATPATFGALTAPNTDGTFEIALKGLVVNTLGNPTVLPYTPTPELTNPFDEFINLDSGGHTSADPTAGSYCDNSAICSGFAGPGGTSVLADSSHGEGSFLTDDPQMYISAASATTAIPTSPSTTVNNPTARNAAIPASTSWTPVNLTVVTDTATFTKSASSIYATQSVSLTPHTVTDVTSMDIHWGDGSTTAGASRTAATKHAYSKAGAWTITVSLQHPAGTITKTVSGKVTVTKDSFKPAPTLTVPSSANKGSSWKTIKGKVTDRGLGATSVTVQLIEKKGGKYYAWTGSKWKKKTSKAKALSAAKKLTATPASGAWHVTGAKPPKGSKLYVTYSALDKAGNRSAAKTYSKKITK